MKNIIFSVLIIMAFTKAVSQPVLPCEPSRMIQCNYFNGNNVWMDKVGEGRLTEIFYPNDGSQRGLMEGMYFNFGAKINDTIRVSRAYPIYENNKWKKEFVPGIINVTGFKDSITNPKYRAYKLIKNWESLPQNDIKELAQKDYDEFPFDLGAPVDANNKPIIYGDQMLWMVCNDAEPSLRSVTATKPLGAEIRITIWGYNDNKELSQVVFYKYVVTNKSNALWKQTYFSPSFGSDISVDIGPSSHAGTDSTLEMGFIYNSYAKSSKYGYLIPSAGIMQLSPKVSSASRFYTTNRSTQGKYGQPDSTYEYYNTFQGLWKDGSPVLDLYTNQPVRFTAAGDPILNTGWTDINEKLTPYFREVQLNSGPFDIAPNESKEIFGAIIIGQGRDYLQSITVLKHHAKYVKSAYPFLFGAGLPSATLSASSLNGKIFLTWDTEAEKELPPLSTYTFQGYYLYQGETANGPWHKIAAFDKADDVSLMLDEEYSSKHLTLNTIVIDELPNKGVRHFLTVERDTLTNSPLIDGRPYHFAVEPFWYDTESRPMYKAGKKSAVTIVPQQIIPGSSYKQAYDLLPHNRKNDDAVQIVVVDPKLLKTKNYSVNISLSLPDSAIRWKVTELPNTVRVQDQTDTTGALTNPVIDGFTVMVKKLPIGIRRDFQNPPGWQYIPETNRWLTGAGANLLMDGFFKGLVYPTKNNYESRGTKIRPDQLKQVMLVFGETQKAYRYATKVRSFPPDPIKDTSFASYIIKKGSGYVFQDFVDVPFTAWEVDSLDGDITPRQLNVAFVESNDSLYSATRQYLGRGEVNGKWQPTTASNGGDERLYIFASDYTENLNTKYYTKNLLTDADSMDIYYVLYARVDTTLSALKKKTWTKGDKFIITPNYQLTDGRTFTFSSLAPTVANATLAKQTNALELVTVFPNPYLGINSLESSPIDHFVTLSGLPSYCTIRVYNLAGRMVRVISHSSQSSSLERWDLRNDEGIKVASGLYLLHIDAPNIGTRILKLMVLYPNERVSEH